MPPEQPLKLSFIFSFFTMASLPDSVAAAAKLMAAAKRPLISVGAGALHAAEEILQLADLLQAPVTAHRSGKGVVSDDSPYGMSSVAAYDYWKNADLLKSVLQGNPGPHRDIVLLNAAPGIMAGQGADDWLEGARAAAR